MEVIDTYAHIMDCDCPDLETGIRLLKKIEYIARVSHRSEERITADSYDRFLRSIVFNHGDFSVIEHVAISAEAVVDRGITHEIVRHRLAEYTQESTRFVNYGKFTQEGEGIAVIAPPFRNPGSMEIWEDGIIYTEKTYMALLANGEPPELARSSLPHGKSSKIIMTYDLRMWRHFFIMRTSKEAHPQMRLAMDPLLEEFKSRIPIIFEDIQPGLRQADQMRLLR